MNYIIGWLLFGVAAYCVAKSKGRSLVFWTVLGLLIGPFALLILAFLPSTEKGDQSYHF
jgi:hypothetical protein